MNFTILTSLAALLSATIVGTAQAQTIELTPIMMSDEIMERLDRQEAANDGVDGTVPPLMVASADVERMMAEMGVMFPAIGDQDAPSEAVMEQMMAQYTRAPDNMRIDFQIQFALNSAILTRASTPQLEEVCGALQNRPEIELRILGHTDTSGPSDHNQRLSAARAVSVRSYLTGTCGIDEDRLSTFGLGETFPIEGVAGNSAQNRRVEFQLAS